VALVHDYIKEFGGAERVLKVLTEIYPKAPIYTAFYIRNSDAGREFKNFTIYESKLALIIKHGRLYSPLRFLLPWIWKSHDLTKYDLVISSCSNYIARGFKVGESASRRTKVIAYCHTPPRFLYGFKTGMDWQKYWPVRIYGNIIAHFLRIFDYKSAQKIDHWIANSENVSARIQKFYHKKSTVIYPPVNVSEIITASEGIEKQNFFLIASRITGAKGLEEAVRAFKKIKVPLKIVGGTAGFTNIKSNLEKQGEGYVEFLGRVDDDALWKLYAMAKGFVALARDEDFGMTVVESQAAGTPVIAFNGGGFKESVVNGKTGILIDDTDAKTIQKAINKLNRTKWSKRALQNNAKRFSKEKFVSKISLFVNTHA